MGDEGKYSTFFQQSRDAIYITDRKGRFLDVNDSMLRLFDLTRPEMLTLDARDLYVDSAERARFQEEMERKGSVTDYEVTLRGKDGAEIECLETATVRHNGDGQVIGYQGTIRDITRRKCLEEQLRQAQKMEAVGELSGGVAHDFNNLLTGITGYAQLALSGLAESSATATDIRRVIELANRAANLTRQLLAFSRRQPLEQEIFNLNTLIEMTSRMLERLVGEHVETRLIAAPDLGNIRADPAQMQQCLFNLTIDARDAMPDGGRLVIETSNVLLGKPCGDKRDGAGSGPYVMLAISDTGFGMDEDTRKRIFEPFFTTKAIGEGTGLGLATVHGIVEQHGGQIRVHSGPGKGTTFKIYLPLVEEKAEDLDAEVDQRIGSCGSETVLLVEDEEAVRSVVQRALSTAGYEVLVASRPSDACRLFSDYSDGVDLLLTDIVMPEMNGPALFLELSKSRPTLKVLYMSGYANRVISHDNGPVSGKPFIQKPFTLAQIARRVRAVLDDQ